MYVCLDRYPLVIPYEDSECNISTIPYKSQYYLHGCKNFAGHFFYWNYERKTIMSNFRYLIIK